ncbi:MAG TPA: hypothetical protein VGF46_00580 [Gaiellales bacterium]
MSGLHQDDRCEACPDDGDRSDAAESDPARSPPDRGGRPGRNVERAVVLQDLPLELVQRGPGREPELAGEMLAQIAEHGQRVGLATGAVEGERQLAHHALTRRV